MFRKNTIQQGTQSTVVRAQFKGRPVVIKHIAAIEGTVAAKKVHREVAAFRNAANGKHPNLIHVLDIQQMTSEVEVDVPQYQSFKPAKAMATLVEYDIVMPYLAGSSLENCSLLFKDPVLLPVAIHLFKQILLGLNHLHQCGLVHGSLTLANILLGEHGTIKIIDLGDAQLIESFVTPLDDLRFQLRPVEKATLTLYNFFTTLRKIRLMRRAKINWVCLPYSKKCFYSILRIRKRLPSTRTCKHYWQSEIKIILLFCCNILFCMRLR
jgi:serine/threonine protein kinase